MKILQTLNDASTTLLQGGVGVIPTDTVYGIVATATNEGAVRRLYSLKNREHKPGTIIAAGVQPLIELGLKPDDVKSVEHLWPDSLSIIIPAIDSLAYLHQGTNSLAIRIPKDENVRAFLEQTGPLLTSSANHPGEPPANTTSEAVAYFGENVDFYVDGGDLSNREPSTIAHIIDGKIEILRPGTAKL